MEVSQYSPSSSSPGMGANQGLPQISETAETETFISIALGSPSFVPVCNHLLECQTPVIVVKFPKVHKEMYATTPQPAHGTMRIDMISRGPGGSTDGLRRAFVRSASFAQEQVLTSPRTIASQSTKKGILSRFHHTAEAKSAKPQGRSRYGVMPSIALVTTPRSSCSFRARVIRGRHVRAVSSEHSVKRKSSISLKVPRQRADAAQKRGFRNRSGSVPGVMRSQTVTSLQNFNTPHSPNKGRNANPPRPSSTKIYASTPTHRKAKFF